MTEWYEAPFKGGPMMAVPGFPRPLYPPDAASKGKTPSVNGPDVVAYKRIAWRLGRWPGPASGFDSAYSNAIAHGKSGNVSETGIAGVQRQAKIEDTGWIGQATFNFFRSVKIPEGCPGPGVPGDYAIDSYTQSLLVMAWEQFGGKEPKPEPEPSQTLRQKALARALTQLGTKESPPNSNHTTYTDWYGMTGPWCAMFASWAYEMSGDSPSFAKGKSYAYVPYMVNDARAYRNGLAATVDPIPGDLVCFDWEGDGVFDHVGLFEKWLSRDQGSFGSVEGNTASDNNGDQSNGGEVCRKTRNVRSASIVFARVTEP